VWLARGEGQHLFAAFFRRNLPKESPATISRLNRLAGRTERGKLGPKERTSDTAAFRAFAPPPFPGGAFSNAGRIAEAKAKAKAKASGVFCDRNCTEVPGAQAQGDQGVAGRG